jgi:hypothetical protein
MKIVITLFLAVAAMAPPAFAEELPVTSPVEMETVTVTGKVEDPLTGSNTLGRSTLEQLPARNGSVNEMLTILPGVQAGEFSRTSDNAGEILPPSLSISGGQFYENNFTIDGVGNNSLLDPAFDDPSNVDNVPGHPQEMFVNPAFIENITVYRSNIPARYSGFTGGVAEITTADPTDTLGGEFRVRHTRDKWTVIHRADERRGEYIEPRDGSVQPHFRKFSGTASLNLPLADQDGLLLGYSRDQSKIPLLLINRTKDQERTLENYFLKYVHRFSPATEFSLSGNYSPYEADYFLKDTERSRYTIENGGYGITGNLKHRFGGGDIELILGHRESSNSRRAPDNYFNWQAKDKTGRPTSKDWGLDVDSAFSKEGGYGDVDKTQETTSAALHLTTTPQQTVAGVHTLAAGLSFEETSGTFERDREMTRYTLATLNPAVVCAPDDIDCISGEQYMSFKNVYPGDDAETTIRFFDAYLQDEMKLWRFSIRPGVHFSSDDLQHNDNWAPRLAVGFDVFGTGFTVLTGGLNRYYGKTLLTHALAAEKANYLVYRRTLASDNRPSPWALSPRSSITTTRVADLDTPHTDEWVVGIEQQLPLGTLNLSYLERNGEDELTTRIRETDANGYTYSEWTNDGSSEHREATLSWEGTLPDHALLLSITWQETETSHSSYIDNLDPGNDGIADRVWYRGKILERYELPRPGFNRELTGALTYIGRLPWGFTFTNVTRYRSGYVTLANTKKDKVLDSGEKLDIYEEVHNPESWIFDWRIDWEKKILREQSLIVSLEVNNVFDAKVESGETVDVYDLGRQFWVGMGYRF